MAGQSGSWRRVSAGNEPEARRFEKERLAETRRIPSAPMPPPEDPNEDRGPLKATPFDIPPEKPMCGTHGHDSGTSRIFIEIEADEGLGEAPSVNVLQTVERMGEAIVGADPLDIAGCVPPSQIVLNTDHRSAVKTFGAIEIGLRDLRGERSLFRSAGTGVPCSAGTAGPCP